VLAARGGALLEAPEPDEPVPPAEELPPELVAGVVEAESAERGAGATRGTLGATGAGGVRGGFVAGAAGTVTGTVGVGSVGRVTVGSGGGSIASAGATSVAHAATAQQRIGPALRIRLYNPRRPSPVTLRRRGSSANCSIGC
jgi:hypothetical protein